MRGCEHACYQEPGNIWLRKDAEQIECEEVSQVNGEKRGRHSKEAKAQRAADLDKCQSATVKIKQPTESGKLPQTQNNCPALVLYNRPC